MDKEQQIQNLMTTSDSNTVELGEIGGNAAIKVLVEYWQSQEVTNNDMAEDLQTAAIHLLALSIIASGSHTDFDEAQSTVKHLVSNLKGK